MDRRATRSQRGNTEKKLKGFVLLDLDTLLYGPTELRAPNNRQTEFDALSRVFRNNLTEYLADKTKPQREWCVTRLIQECTARAGKENVARAEAKFLKGLETELIRQLPATR